MTTMEESQFISQFLAVFAGSSTKYPKDFIPPGLAPNVTSKRVTFERPTKATKEPASTTDTVEVTIKSLKSGQYTVEVSAAGTILDLKEALARTAGIDVQSQRLVLKGKALVDSKPLVEYGIGAGSVVHLFAKAGVTLPTSGEAAPTAEAPTSTDAPSATAAVAAATAAAAKKVTSYRGLSEAGTDTARSSEFWYELHSYLSKQLGKKEDADMMLKGFLGQYRDLVGNAATKAIETELKNRP